MGPLSFFMKTFYLLLLLVIFILNVFLPSCKIALKICILSVSVAYVEKQSYT